MTKKFKNHVEAFYWTCSHPKLTGRKNSTDISILEITPHMVNPLNSTIEDDTSLNTKSEWWVEIMQKITDEHAQYSHVWPLDCSGDSIEDAILKAAQGVFSEFGDY